MVSLHCRPPVYIQKFTEVEGSEGGVGGLIFEEEVEDSRGGGGGGGFSNVMGKLAAKKTGKMGASFLSNQLNVPLTLRARCTTFSDCALQSVCTCCTRYIISLIGGGMPITDQYVRCQN